MSRLALGRLVIWAVLVAAPAGLGALAGAPSWPWAICGGLLVLAGLAAIRMTRGRWLTAPFLMLLLCTAGMTVGLWLDRQWVGEEVLATLCLGAPHSIIGSALRHWAVLRATNLGMLLGGVTTIGVVELRARRHPAMRCRKAVCGQAGFNLMCNTAMVGGMMLGGWLGPALAADLGLGWGTAAMVAVMVAGMVWGMAGSMTLYRLCFSLLDGWSHRPTQPVGG